MLVNRTIEMCLKHPEKTDEILVHMGKNRSFGMQTFDQHLVDLVKAKKISMEQAKIAANKPEEVERALTLE
jgi:twitching motility protein PilT